MNKEINFLHIEKFTNKNTEFCLFKMNTQDPIYKGVVIEV